MQRRRNGGEETEKRRRREKKERRRRRRALAELEELGRAQRVELAEDVLERHGRHEVDREPAARGRDAGRFMRRFGLILRNTTTRGAS